MELNSQKRAARTMARGMLETLAYMAQDPAIFPTTIGSDGIALDNLHTAIEGLALLADVLEQQVSEGAAA